MGWRILVSKIVLLLSSSPFFEYANERPFVGCGMYLLTFGDNILGSMYHLDSECRLTLSGPGFFDMPKGRGGAKSAHW